MTGKGTTQLLDELLKEGFDAGPAYVSFLLRERAIPKPPKGPGGALVWEPQHEASLRAELRRRGRAPVDHGRGVGEAGAADRLRPAPVARVGARQEGGKP